MTLRRAPFLPSVALEELGCAALFAFFAMQGFIPGIAPSVALEMTGSAPTGLTTIGGILSQAAADVFILLLLLRRPRLLLRSIPGVPWTAALALLAIASTLWSLDPLLTLRRSVPFALAGLFGLYFATRFPAHRQFAILRMAMIALALATIALVVLVPSIGLDHTPGHAADWQGVFTQKNACGRIMVLATAVTLFDFRQTTSRAAALVLFAFVLVMSGSRGAWMIEAAVGLLCLVLLFARRASPRLRTVLGVSVPFATGGAAVAAVALLPHLMRIMGRDPTLSGRTAIWKQVVHFLAQRPFFGYGYDAFWRGMTGPSAQIDSAVHFIVEHAHNGFLEIGLELGGVGLVLFAMSWLRGARRLWALWRSGPPDRIAFPLVFLVLLLLYDLDENTLLIYNGLFWPLYVAALANIESAAQAARKERGERTSDRRHAARCTPRGMLRDKPVPQEVL